MDANDTRNAGSWLTDAQNGGNEGFQARIRDLIAYWTANRGVDGVPVRSCFTPERLRPWIGNLSIYQQVDDGRDFRVRLEGTNITQITGDNWTGRLISEIDARFGTNFLGDVKTVLARREPSLTHCRVFQREYKPAERALLPIASQPGHVDQVFLCLYVVNGKPARAFSDRARAVLRQPAMSARLKN